MIGQTRERGRVGVLVALSLLATAACARGATPTSPAASSTTTTAAASSSAASTPHAKGDVNANGTPDSSPDDTDWPGRMVVTYDAATSPEAVRGRDLLKDNHLLENFAEDVNTSLKLPYNVPLVGAQCDEANAYWSHDNQSITLCYEDADDALSIYTKAGDPDPTESALNAELATLLHELGHAVIDLYSLPVTGKEEDAADQLAAYMLLTPGPDGQLDPTAVKAVKDFARAFEEYSARDGGEFDEGQLADVHSLNPSRMYNLECWVYGADPAGNADLVSSGALPQDRADGCPDEFALLSDSWAALLGPYVR